MRLLSTAIAIYLSDRAAPRVDGWRDRLQVIGIDAGPIAAQVVEDQPFGDGAYEQLPCDAMRPEILAAEHEASIAIEPRHSRPLPADSAHIDLGEEPNSVCAS